MIEFKRKNVTNKSNRAEIIIRQDINIDFVEIIRVCIYIIL